MAPNWPVHQCHGTGSFLPRPESIVYRIFMLVHFIPQNSLPCPVGTGDREASLAPLRSFEICTHQNLISSLVCWKSWKLVFGQPTNLDELGQRKMIHIEITFHLVMPFWDFLKIALFQEFREHCVKYKNAILSWHSKKRAQNEGC